MSADYRFQFHAEPITVFRDGGVMKVKVALGQLASDIVERANYCREWGNFDALHGELLAEVERLRRSEWAARGERDSMKRRLELLSADESWWVGGVWGHYGEVVVPVRAIAMVLGEKMVDQKKPGEPEIDPGLAATYRDLRATVEHLASENERLQAALSEAKP